MKLTYMSSPRLVFVVIPGGPGLSTSSLGNIAPPEDLGEFLFLNPPGVGNTPPPSRYLFQTFLEAMEDRIVSLYPDRELCLIGHSFGGLLATGLIAHGKLPVTSWVGLASPLSLSTYQAISENYQRLKTSKMAAAEASFSRNPGDETLREWLISLAPFYFSPPKRQLGIELLKRDQIDSRAFQTLYPEFLQDLTGIDFLETLRKFDGKKMLIAGEKDFIPQSALEKDARAAEAAFHVIPEAHHFLWLDAPERAIQLLRDEI